MIQLKEVNSYLKAIESGFECYGLNGFYQMHKDMHEREGTPWDYELESLNDLDMGEFELLCSVYLKGIK